jgi:diguanylate cyclase (GGDEF)-like protein
MIQMPPADTEEISPELLVLIEALLADGQRVEDMTAGEVDTVTNQSGRTILLRRAQEYMRNNETARQAAILNALPTQIALLDSCGKIVSVNDAWRRFADTNGFIGPDRGAGVDYLKVCDAAAATGGDDAVEAASVAAGIRSVLNRTSTVFSIDYPCHSPTQPRWFLMSVTALDGNPPGGAVVMHLDISERKQAEKRVAYLNRVYATLSGINTLIVRETDRDRLFSEACRIAVEVGEFHVAWIGAIDQRTMKTALVASAGGTPELLHLIGSHLMLDQSETHGTSLTEMAISGRQAIVANDLQHDSRLLFGAQHAELGNRSMAVFPLIVLDEVIGVFVLCAAETGFFREEELVLLRELADDIAFAVDHIHKHEQLAYLAYYDVLTGLANRTLFLERMAQSVRSAASADHKLAVFIFNLERFKNINDSLGRAAGDELLVQVGKWLTDRTGDAGLLARVGADVFAIVLPEVTREGYVARLVENTIEDFQAHPFRLNEKDFRIAARVGIALFPDDGDNAEALFGNAEAALKKAKKTGERYQFYTQGMTETVGVRLTLENQLRQALDREEFELYYQPKVNLASGKVSGAEALIRWNDPRTGLVPPAQFIPVLEETGLINPVGRWALRRAIDDYLGWFAAGFEAVPVAVNVSPLQLRNRAFIEEVRQAIGIDSRAAAGLELEITESLIMEDARDSIAILQAIRGMGVRIAIDDFGTGFSSLNYLTRLPVDTLKIDRSFVVDMTDGPVGLALVSAIINLAHALKLKVVAEGVATGEQSRLLHLLNCDEIQGFVFSKPLPCAVFESTFLTPRPGGQIAVQTGRSLDSSNSTRKEKP